MDKYNATKAILNALKNGEHVSQMDCSRYQIEDMRTVVSHLRPKYEETHTLHSKWVRTPVRNARIKEYWLESR